MICKTCGRDLSTRECSDPEHRAARAEHVKTLPGTMPVVPGAQIYSHAGGRKTYKQKRALAKADERTWRSRVDNR